jgi:heptose-I-phosphate ethanolaminephosphotransferase
MAGFPGLRDALLMSVVWLIPILLWPKQTKVLTALIGATLWLASLTRVGYWLIYGQEFSQSAIFIIFESNPAEGREFIESYLRWWHVLVFAIYSVIPLILWRLMPPLSLALKARYT